MWCNKELEGKKLRYCKEVIKPNLEDQKEFVTFVTLRGLKMKITFS
jgi:hypothetical protein